MIGRSFSLQPLFEGLRKAANDFCSSCPNRGSCENGKRFESVETWSRRFDVHRSFKFQLIDEPIDGQQAILDWNSGKILVPGHMNYHEALEIAQYRATAFSKLEMDLTRELIERTD